MGGQPRTLLVHRKGSTRAFPPHHPLIPVDYQLTGQPVLIGGTMGTCSYVLTGGWPAVGCAAPPGRCRRGPKFPGKQARAAWRWRRGAHLRRLPALLHPSCPTAVQAPTACLPQLARARTPCRLQTRFPAAAAAARRHGEGHAGDVWVDLPRRGPRALPQQLSQQARLPAGAGRAEDQGHCHQVGARGAARRGAQLQPCQQCRRQRRPSARHRATSAAGPPPRNRSRLRAAAGWPPPS